MDLFAAILITITAVTICGIFLFIFVCALQPNILRKLHGKRTEINHDTDSNASSNNNEDNLSVKSLDLAIELTTENSSISPKSTNREKKAYLKSLEQSFRRGGKIKKDENDENESHSNPLNFICRFINQHIRRRRTTTDTHETAEL